MVIVGLIGLIILLAGLCGPSSQEKEQAKESAAFTQGLRQHYADKYDKMNAVLDKLNDTINAPATLGFGPEERASYHTQALENTAANYSNAARAVGEQMSGRGGDSGLQSGVDSQIKAQLASEAAKTLSQQEQAIVQGDYETGRAEKQRRITGLEALAGFDNPENTAQLSEGSATQAFSMAKSNREAANAWKKTLAGVGTSLAQSGLAALSGGASLAATKIPGIGGSGAGTEGGADVGGGSVVYG